MSKVTTKPELEVKNVWCPKCGKQTFEHRYSLLVCTNCGTTIEWSTVWEEWHGSSSPCHLGFDKDKFPSGVRLESQFNGYQYTMVDQYNPNTGKKLADPRARESLLKVRSYLEKKLTRVDHQLELGSK